MGNKILPRAVRGNVVSYSKADAGEQPLVGRIVGLSRGSSCKRR